MRIIVAIELDDWANLIHTPTSLHQLERDDRLFFWKKRDTMVISVVKRTWSRWKRQFWCNRIMGHTWSMPQAACLSLRETMVCFLWEKGETMDTWSMGQSCLLQPERDNGLFSMGEGRADGLHGRRERKREKLFPFHKDWKWSWSYR